MRQLFVMISIAAILGLGAATISVQAQNVETTKKKARVLEKKDAGEGSKAPAAPIKQPEAQAVDPAGKGALNDPITCLSRAIYWEARGDGVAGMEAIANVVMNRLGHEGFPDTVCKIVKENDKKGDCQFTWWCHQRAEKAKNEDAYAIAKEISRRALNRQLPDRTGGALYFHQKKVNPSWSKEYIKTVEIGQLIFYKPRGGTAK
jgi:spore germination cell wall hydrolase CwlJ-like protein